VLSPDEWLLQKLSRPPGSADYRYEDEDEIEADPLALLRHEYPGLRDLAEHKRVADFGCGRGTQAMALASACDCSVVGIDTNPRWLAEAQRLARERELPVEKVSFLPLGAAELFESFDVVVSQNAMEHYPQPDTALETMRRLLRPGGQLLLTFGPPWFAPWGAHMRFFCRVPWVNLLFRERTVMSVRARYRGDGARHYEEVESGLNRMSLRKLEALLQHSPLEVEHLHYRGVKGQHWVARVPVLRELLVNHVTCILRRPD